MQAKETMVALVHILPLRMAEVEAAVLLLLVQMVRVPLVVMVVMVRLLALAEVQ
jgi:hypothetical protein